MTFKTLITEMMTAACAGRFDQAAACFTEDGVYHDVFYGAFQGRERLIEMFAGHFHRDGEDFRWVAHDPVSDGEIGYTRYTFSYRSKLKDSLGKRASFEGVAICRLRDGLIADYREVANACTGLRMLGFSDARLGRFVDREVAELNARSEMSAHR